MYKITLCCLYLMAFTPFMCWALTEAQRDQIHQHFEAVGAECIADNPVTPDDVENLRSKTLATGENVPCFLSCMFKKIGILDDQGMLAHEAVVELAKKVFDNEDELNAVRNYLQSCQSVNSETVSDGNKGCERAVFAFKCMSENASKFGFQL